MAHFGSLTIHQSPGEAPPPEPRPLGRAIKRGFLGRCPHCDNAPLFRAYLKPVDICAYCGEELHHHRADDLPAYLVAVVVGHIMVGGWLLTEALWHLSSWQHLAIWTPLAVAAALLLLQPIKGAVIALQWANRMHGFGSPEDDPALAPLREPRS